MELRRRRVALVPNTSMGDGAARIPLTNTDSVVALGEETRSAHHLLREAGPRRPRIIIVWVCLLVVKRVTDAAALASGFKGPRYIEAHETLRNDLRLSKGRVIANGPVTRRDTLRRTISA